MSLAEQKEKLHQLIREADEETTAKAMDFFRHLNNDNVTFSDEDLMEFSRRSEEHTANPQSGIPWEESLARIRSKLKKGTFALSFAHKPTSKF